MTEWVKLANSLVQAVMVYAKSAKDRRTLKALIIATRIKHIDAEIKQLREDKTRDEKWERRIKVLDEKKWAYWRKYEDYVTAN